MTYLTSSTAPPTTSTTGLLSPFSALGVLIGIIMPVASVLLCSNYSHTIATPWVQWARLSEIVFIMSEVVVIFYALGKQFTPSAQVNALPVDIKLAALVLAIGLFASSVFISAVPLISLAVSFFTLIHLLFALAVYHLVITSETRDYTPFITALGAGLVSLTVLTAWKFGFPPPASQVPGGIINWDSALPGFLSIRHFGSWTGAVAAGFMAAALYTPERRLSAIHFFYFLASALTIWSGTRAAILAMIVTAVLIAVVQRRLPSFRNCGVMAMITGAALIAAWLLLPANEPVFLLYNPVDVSTPNMATGGRLELWAATISKWLESPWFGWGSQSQMWEVFVNWAHLQPHNVVLQFLISWGVVGAVGGLWLLGRTIAATHRHVATRLHFVPLLAVLYALLLQSLLEGMMHYPRFVMLIMALFAIILADKKRLTALQSPQPAR